MRLNKYQDALAMMCYKCHIHNSCKSKTCNPINILLDLVDKATPKKPRHFVHERYTRYYCPKCSKRLKKSWSACPICTTMIDWSDEE